MSDYKKIDFSHRLSSYRVQIPNWTGDLALRAPFSKWSKDEGLPWYEAYNATKHDRLNEFEEATFENLIDAMSALLVILSSQFGSEDFLPSTPYLALHGPSDGFESGIGNYFRVGYPDDFPTELRYDFDWQKIKSETDPFLIYDYSKVSRAKSREG